MVRETSLFTLSDAEGRILLQHRTDDAPVLAGMWGFFGGGVEGVETPEQALQREAREELEIELPTMDKVGVFVREAIRAGREPITCHLFLGSFGALETDLERLRASQREGQDLGLFTFPEIDRLPHTPRDHVLFRALASRLGREFRSDGG